MNAPKKTKDGVQFSAKVGGVIWCRHALSAIELVHSEGEVLLLLK